MSDQLEARLSSSALENNRFAVTALRGSERISTPFRFDVEVVWRGLSPNEPPPTPVELIGMPVTLELIETVQATGRDEVRFDHGLIAEARSLLDPEAVNHEPICHYRLHVAPRVHQLSLIETQEAFLDMSYADILIKKLSLIGIGPEGAAFRLITKDVELVRNPREFTVQYRETDLTLITRLCEHVGVSFFFEQDEGADRIVFTNTNSGFLKADHPFEFEGRGEGHKVFRLEEVAQLVPAVYVVSDYNYRRPELDLSSMHELASGDAGGVIEYGTHFKSPEEGAELARIRAEERGATRVVFEGSSDRPGIAAGLRFTLEGHPSLGDIELLVTEVSHELVQASMGGDTDRPARYVNTFRAILAEVPYRTPRRTPRPRIHGITSAIVEAAPGSSGTQPWLDELGRYVVRLLFDTGMHGDQGDSRPIRMAQPHAGPDYGIHFPLRPGTEVLLSYIDGDPDRPVIMSSVPNLATPTPVVDRDALVHRIKTSSGVLIEIDDGE